MGAREAGCCSSCSRPLERAGACVAAHGNTGIGPLVLVPAVLLLGFTATLLFAAKVIWQRDSANHAQELAGEAALPRLCCLLAIAHHMASDRLPADCMTEGGHPPCCLSAVQTFTCC